MSRPSDVLHGINAVAKLKHQCTNALIHPCIGVLHGINAVAKLKPASWSAVITGRTVLHGINAVAKLKPRSGHR